MGGVFFIGLVFLVLIAMLGLATIVMNVQAVSPSSTDLELDKVDTIANVNIAHGVLSILGAVALVLYSFFTVILGCGMAILIIGILMKSEVKKHSSNIRVESILSLILVAVEIIVPVAYFIINH